MAQLRASTRDMWVRKCVQLLERNRMRAVIVAQTLSRILFFELCLRTPYVGIRYTCVSIIELKCSFILLPTEAYYRLSNAEMTLEL